MPRSCSSSRKGTPVNSLVLIRSPPTGLEMQQSVMG